MNEKHKSAKLAVLKHLNGVMGKLESNKMKNHTAPKPIADVSHQVVEMQADGHSPVGLGAPEMHDGESMEGLSSDGSTAPHMANELNPHDSHKEFEDEDLEKLRDHYSKL